MLGINSYTYMWSIGFQGANPAYPDKAARPSNPLTALDLLTRALQLGVRLVQTGPNLPIEALPAPMLDKFIGTARDEGIQLELGTRGLDLEHLTGEIALARRMGVTLIRTIPEIRGKAITTGKELVPLLQKLLPMLTDEGVRIALENGRIPAGELHQALDEVDSPLIGITLDLVNSLAVPEGWREVTRQLAPHTMCVHYKDFTIRRAWHMMGFICEGAPAGRGMLDPVWLLKALKISPYRYNLIVELWTPEQASLVDTIALEQRWAVESINFLRQYIQD